MHARMSCSLLFLIVAAMPAPAGSMPTIPWHTIDGGGGESSSASGLVLRGTFGQWDAGVTDSSRHEVEGGFWPGGENDILFIDGFES